jgi:hypothetical protein
MLVSNRLGDLSGRMRGFASRGQALLKPPPIHFGAPRQVAVDPGLAWWAVPLFIEPGAMHQKLLEACRVEMVPIESGSMRMRMCWRTADSTNTRVTQTLDEGRLYLVPVAARKESASRQGIITNETFLAEGKAKWAMPPGRTRWKLAVISGEREWESTHVYVLTVPPPDRSNGQFTLEIRYESFE